MAIGYDMNIDVLKDMCQRVYRRISELDHEQFDKIRVRDTRDRGAIVRQAATEIIGNPSWRPVVMLICEGASYYGLCEEWFKDIP